MPLASCADTLMRKVEKHSESYILAPSGSVKKGPTSGGTSEITPGMPGPNQQPGGAMRDSSRGNQQVPLFGYSLNIVADPDGHFDDDVCKIDLVEAWRCSEGDQLCMSWGEPTPSSSTKLAYGAVLLAGNSSTAKKLSRTMFPLPPHAEPVHPGGEPVPGCPPQGAALCFNPEAGDPAGLCCGLAQTILQCNGVDQACFRRHMCGHCQVAQFWKDKNCNGHLGGIPGCIEDPEMLQQKSLKDRASSQASESNAEGSSLDEALEDKVCSADR